MARGHAGLTLRDAATITLGVYTTALPAGRYTGVLAFTAHYPKPSTTYVGVVYNVTAP